MKLCSRNHLFEGNIEDDSKSLKQRVAERTGSFSSRLPMGSSASARRISAMLNSFPAVGNKLMHQLCSCTFTYR